MKAIKFKSVTFCNKQKKIKMVYTLGKIVTLPYKSLGIQKNIKNITIDKETNKKTLILEFIDDTKEFLPYDQPLYIVQDPEYMLQNHIEQLIASIKEQLYCRKISKKYLARHLNISEYQIQNLLNPYRLNKNLQHLYQLAHFLGLEMQFKIAN